MLQFRIIAAFIAVVGILQNASTVLAQSTTDARKEGEAFFERKIRPVLAEHCYKCHGPDKQKGELRLDSRKAILTGGETGPALVPGSPEQSLLMKGVNWEKEEFRMPSGKKLPDTVIADLKTWIKMGAPWPGAESTETATQPGKSRAVVTDEDRKYWAYQPVQRPKVAAPAGVSPIDALIAVKLEAKKLTLNPQATKRELLRRAYFDLIGLPPTPEEVERFERDSSPKAFEKVIDDLLARPQYGERWARHWLDVVRYAQTNGYERDGDKPLAWRYRDYVIRAFNEDKPYDRFVIEQLAGDELDTATDDSIIATGFYRLGVWDDEPDDLRMAEYDDLDDTMVATGSAFLGMTLGCARCHDHKIDPIPQADYYRFLAFIRNVRRYEPARFDASSGNFVPLGDRQALQEKLRSRLQPLQEALAKSKDQKEQKWIRDQIAKLNQEFASANQWALAVRDGADKPTHVLVRGNSGSPAQQVEPGFPSVLTGQKPVIVPPKMGGSSGKRLALARWIASPENPMTARVMANRIWKHHFGRGIVKTTADFGKGGLPPTHPELLDWLASEFVAGNWSMKKLHKTIMLSNAYQCSAATMNEQAMKADPANDLFWHQNLHRLDAEVVRDSILFVSGQLNPEAGGHGFYPHLAGEVLAGGSRPGDGWNVSSPKEQNRRSIYAFIKRSMLPPFFEGFDYATTSSPLSERPVTTVAPQALMLLNDQFMHEKAEAFAERLTREVGDDAAKQIAQAYRLALGRLPSDREKQIALAYLERQTQANEAIRSRLTFAPDVPLSLHQSYMNKLQPQDYLIGPRAGWNYSRGRWNGGYEGILTVDRNRGPFALWQGNPSADAIVETEVTFQKAMELGSILLRTTANGDGLLGYEVLFDVREQAVLVKRHADTVTTLGKVQKTIPTGQSFPVKIELVGGMIRVWLGEGKPILEVTDASPLPGEGRLGIRCWGAAMSLDHLRITTANKTIDVATAPLPNVQRNLALAPKGWKQWGGAWSIGNETAYAVEPAAGAKAIWNQTAFADGIVETEIALRSETGDAGLLVRVQNDRDGVDALDAYNINFQAGVLRLGKHQQNWKELQKVPLKLAPNQWHHVKVEMKGSRLQVFVDHAKEPQIDYTDSQPLPAGKVGLRSMNARFAIKGLKTTVAGKTTLAEFQPQPEDRTFALGRERRTPQQKALASLCLLILNLNEFVYVD